MRVNVKQFGITVDYNPSGSSAGRKNFLNGTVDFAASDIPFQFEPEDGSAPENPAPGSYAYIPVTAGGTAFMYNLNDQRPAGDEPAAVGREHLQDLHRRHHAAGTTRRSSPTTPG